MPPRSIKTIANATGRKVRKKEGVKASEREGPPDWLEVVAEEPVEVDTEDEEAVVVTV